MVLRRKFPQVYELEHPKKGRYWLVSARSAKWGLNERKTFAARKFAEKYAADLEEQLLKFGRPTEVPNEKNVMADRFQGLAVQLEYYGKSPEDAVAHYVQHLGNEMLRLAKPFISDLADKWVEFKKADTTLTKRFLAEVAAYAAFIKRKWGCLKPDEPKRNQIDLLIKGLKVSNNTRRKYLRYVRMFFKWMMDEGFVTKNPTDGIKFKPDDFNAEFYTPDETSNLLRYVVEHDKDLVGYFALLAFAGLRPSEGERVQWVDYRPKVSELYVREGKTGARHVILEPVAVAWMEFHRKNTPEGSPFLTVPNLENRMKKIRKAVFNGEWIQDGLRHGFGTYFKALTQNIGKVADYMGNSPDIVKRHYARTIAKEDWETFWNMTPEKVTAEKSAFDASDAGMSFASESEIKFCPKKSALCP